MYAVLYDKNFSALGSLDNIVASQHYVKSWSLKRRAYEMDDFNCVCKGYRNSKNACFIGLHNNDGTLKYVSFSGIPYIDEDGMTHITGVDCRQLFNQELIVNYYNTTAGYTISNEKELYEYLLSKVFSESINSCELGVTYKINTDECSSTAFSDKSSILETGAEARNVWDQIQACNNYFKNIVVTEWNVTKLNKYELTFYVRKLTDVYSLRLSDFNVHMTMTNNIVNRARVVDPNDTTTPNKLIAEYYIYKCNDNGDMTIESTYDEDEVLFPPKTQIIEVDYDEDADSSEIEEAIENAKIEAEDTLYANLYKDKVTIDLNSKLGLKLTSVPLYAYGLITGYNPADVNSVKKLPVYSISEDSNGNKSIEFGKLSDYWFLD